MGKICFFMGHREAGDALLTRLTEEVERCAGEGVTDFVVGQYGGFDRLAARAVRSVKKRFPQVTLTLLLPYYQTERPVPLPEGFDDSFYPPGMETVPKWLAIVRANRYMADHCDVFLAYVRHPGNSRELLEYMRNREKRGLVRVVNLGDGGAGV